MSSEFGVINPKEWPKKTGSLPTAHRHLEGNWGSVHCHWGRLHFDWDPLQYHLYRLQHDLPPLQYDLYRLQ